ncbi:hypothetical protein H7J73_31715 [Mycolicibacterium komossense]|uniref:Acetoacetate decarboxylase n=2 Tax=Mycolicibacterium komossense TaxID=1779 RepID=A0ABT3CMC5_9MYCO|nr:hypothetical protein [Mycolicibacterium komossense]
MVVGSWSTSPFGRFADVMVETSDGERILLAPSAEVAEFVSATYSFDGVVLGPVTVEQTATTFSVTGPELDATCRVGGPAAFDWLLRLVPGPIAIAPLWLRAINPVAGRLMPGVHTAGSAGHGRREFYGVRRTHRIAELTGEFRGASLDGLADLNPPVRFGFSSAPTVPQLVSVTTTIDLP